MDTDEVTRNCKNCNNLIPMGSKFWPECGAEIQFDKDVVADNKEVILSTGNIDGDYSVIGIVHYFHLTFMNKEKFGDKNLSFDNTVDKIIDILIDKTIKAGGDGITFLRVESNAIQLGGTQIFVYGTMIKRKQNDYPKPTNI